MKIWTILRVFLTMFLVYVGLKFGLIFLVEHYNIQPSPVLAALIAAVAFFVAGCVTWVVEKLINKKK